LPVETRIGAFGMTLPPESLISAAARTGHFPDGLTYRSLPLDRSAHIAAETNLPLKTIELTALENGVLPERYVRNLHTYRPEDQARLLRSRACVVGLGGLGGLVTELLARAGVGTLILVDGDRFEESNLNRQIFCTTDRIGYRKADVAAQRVVRINEAITVRAELCFLDTVNAPRLLADCDVAIDCLDNIADRRVLAQAAQDRSIPLVTAAVAGTCGQLAVLMPGDTTEMTAIYGEDSAIVHGAETALGCTPQAVAVLAGLECSEVLKLILGQEGTLRGQLLLFDLDRAFFHTVRLT